MIRIKLPSWMRDEVSHLITKQMAIARMLAVRLIDSGGTEDSATKARVRLSEVARIIAALDTLSEELNKLVGGTPAFANDPDDYKRVVAYAAYCDRALMYRQKKRVRE